jgi:hypothetical protein
MQKHIGPLIIGASIVLATCIYLYFSPFQQCVRSGFPEISCMRR